MAGGEELKLLGWWAPGVSPYVLRAQMALAVKGLSYEYLPEDRWCKSDLLIASNPVYKKVPVLIHNGKPICESLLIVEYLDDALGLPGNGKPILPADPYSRALARFWAAYANDKLFPSCAGILKTVKQEERAGKVEETLSGLRHLEAILAECSKGEVEAPFFGGDDIGFLDIALGCYLPWFEAVGRLAGLGPIVDPARTPKLAAWAERFRVAEPVKALLPGVDELEEYITKVLYPKWNIAVTSN
ncbi:probable glutathione S-transferase GSTU6 [Triticum urartu]|uniref:Glutathione S-transferase n=1 Tax=Triticum urartu TaxID=4572 RepID=A0A8R7QX50_TRIUA|nr:probable glutathione S-transferase GSTU6 [Triticum urartu]